MYINDLVKLYLWLFWFLVDLAIDNAYIIKSFWREEEDQLKCKNKEFHKQLASSYRTLIINIFMGGCMLPHA